MYMILNCFKGNLFVLAKRVIYIYIYIYIYIQLYVLTKGFMHDEKGLYAQKTLYEYEEKKSRHVLAYYNQCP